MPVLQATRERGVRRQGLVDGRRRGAFGFIGIRVTPCDVIVQPCLRTTVATDLFKFHWNTPPNAASSVDALERWNYGEDRGTCDVHSDNIIVCFEVRNRDLEHGDDRTGWKEVYGSYI